MIGLADLGQSLAYLGARFAAPAANNSATPGDKAVAEPIVKPDTATGEKVSISAEGKRLLQADTGEQVLSAEGARLQADAELAARLARDLAYRRDADPPVSTAADRGDGTYGAGATSPEERVRAQRIAFYELERAKGTSPEKLYEKLVTF